ncbi:MAG: hypothetical protein ABW321_18750, partial [Polyangiales bacterium]
MFAGALLVACGQEAGSISNTPTSGSTPTTTGGGATTTAATAYAALSVSLDACEEKQAECVAAAAGDVTAIAACDTAAETCVGSTREMARNARDRLCDDAEGCVRDHGCRGRGRDDDAGVSDGDADGGADDESCRGRRECVARNAPQIPECVETLWECLDA